jgi:peroxin-5
MSFMGGAECSTAGNPLSQFQKHVQDDKTLQRDRLVGRGPGGQLGGFRSSPANAPQDEVRDLIRDHLFCLFTLTWDAHY